MPRVSPFRLAILHSQAFLFPDSARLASPQKAVDTDVLVNARPVNPVTLTNQTELGALLRSCVEEPREPRERHADPSTICERYRQFVVRRFYFGGKWNYFNFRNAHPKPQRT